MKTRQILLGVMVMSAMLSAYADDNNDPNHPHGRGQQQRSDEQHRPAINAQQPNVSRAQMGAAAGARSTFAPPLPLPTQQPAQQAIQRATQQSQVGNRPVEGGGGWQGRGQSNDNRRDGRDGNGGGRWNGSSAQTTTVTTTNSPPAPERFQGGQQRNDQWRNNDRRGNDNRGVVAGVAGAGAATAAMPRWQQNQSNTRPGWNPAAGQSNSTPRNNWSNGQDGAGWSRDNRGHPIRTAPDRSWSNHYRMPYADGTYTRYSVRWHRGWQPGYSWRDHGWRSDYQTVDPYWFAVVTSMAYAQSWSDDELTQAINDDNLRQQLLYDASVRQQMVESGFPQDQVDYPPQVLSGDPSSDPNYSGGYYQGYNQSTDPYVGYDPQRDPTYDPSYDPRNDPNYVPTNAPVYTTTRTYVTPPPPSSLDPYSPNSPSSPDNGYGSVGSGDQVANRNANKNVMFFCNAKNRAETARAFKQVQSVDLSVWDIESFNTCRIWSGAK